MTILENIVYYYIITESNIINKFVHCLHINIHTYIMQRTVILKFLARFEYAEYVCMCTDTKHDYYSNVVIIICSPYLMQLLDMYPLSLDIPSIQVALNYHCNRPS